MALKILAAIFAVFAFLAAPAASPKPSDHSYSLIRIYTPRAGSEERRKIVSAATRNDDPALEDRPDVKILIVRAAELTDPQIWETDDWSIAFLRYRYTPYGGGGDVTFQRF